MVSHSLSSSSNMELRFEEGDLARTDRGRGCPGRLAEGGGEGPTPPSEKLKLEEKTGRVLFPGNFDGGGISSIGGSRCDCC